MNEKDIDSEQFIEELMSCGEFPLKLNAYQAYICVCLFQLALKHPDLKPGDATYKTANTIARFLHGELAKRSALIGEVLQEGWDEYFMLDIQFEEKEQKAANFSDLDSKRQYQLALLFKAFETLAVHASELESLPGREIREDAMLNAAAILNNNLEESVGEVIKELDENRFID